MTDTPQNPPTFAALVDYKYSSSSLAVLSIDFSEYGALIVDSAHSVRLLPWHTVGGIEFLDDSLFQPLVALTDPAIPARHEGSE